jgi:hypothetical protein
MAAVSVAFLDAVDAGDVREPDGSLGRVAHPD